MNRIHMAVRATLLSILILGLLTFAHFAGAATVTLTNGASCSYGAVTGDGAGNLTYSCAAVVTPTPNPNPPPPPPTPPAGSCPGAHVNLAFTWSGQKHELRLAPGQVAAIAFNSGPSSDIDLNTTETVETPISADHQASVSKCPGDFSPPWPCSFSANLAGSTLWTTTGIPPRFFAKCKLEPNTIYYFNVRQVVRGTITPSCELGACTMRVQIQNYPGM